MDRHINDQEQVEILKQFWTRWGNHILTVITVVALSIAGWHLYSRYHQKQLEKASVGYTMLLNQMLVPEKSFNAKAFAAQAQDVIQQDKGMGYATLASMLLAKVQIRDAHLAQAEATLQSALKNTSNAAYKAILTERIARLMTAQNKAQQALVLLKTVPTGYDVVYGMAQAQAYSALKQYRKAREIYQEILKKIPKQSSLRKTIYVYLSGLSQ